mgnify:CR=1 FL=1
MPRHSIPEITLMNSSDGSAAMERLLSSTELASSTSRSCGSRASGAVSADKNEAFVGLAMCEAFFDWFLEANMVENGRCELVCRL